MVRVTGFELAVDSRFERRGLGTIMVKFAFVRAEKLRNSSLGIQYIALCADPCAVSFYERPELGFAKIGDYEDIPRDGWNKTCVPMFVRIKFDKVYKKNKPGVPTKDTPGFLFFRYSFFPNCLTSWLP